MNNIINNAVTSINNENAERANQEAIRLIGLINDAQANIASAQSRIASHQQELQKVNDQFVTAETVFGGAVPQTPNSATIVAVIEKMNKDRQFSVEQKAQRLTAAILSETDAIKAFETRIVELRKKLSEVTTIVVEVANVIG